MVGLVASLIVAAGGGGEHVPSHPGLVKVHAGSFDVHSTHDAPEHL
jgi:hypothetical protein